MNKKGGALSIIVWVAGVFVIIFFLAGWVYFHNVLTNALLDVKVDNNIVNFTGAVQNTFVPLNNSMSGLSTISFILLITLGFSILIENFYIRKHPILFFVHVLIVIVGIVGSIYISNAYETLLNNNILSPTLNTFKASSYIALFLPYWVAIIGIFGLILLVINAVRDPETKGVGL